MRLSVWFRLFGPIVVLATAGLFSALGSDEDGDGLPDAWESEFFGDPTNGVTTVDADTDGANNLSEFIAQTDPTNSQSRLQLTGVTVSGQNVSFSFFGAAGRAYAVEAADALGGNWDTRTNIIGTGTVASYTENAGATQSFYRVSVNLAAGFLLSPDTPRLAGGAVSLPDASAGGPYLLDIAPCPTNAGPYTLQILGTPPAGLGAAVLDNNSAAAKVRVTHNGSAMTVGERLQFTVRASGATNNSVTNVYDLRVVTPPPSIATESIDSEAGVALSASLVVSNGTGPFTWSLGEGSLPQGVALSPSGMLSGTPSADDAEFNEDGLFTVTVQVSDSHTNRVTGALAPRIATREVAVKVRLSYELNIYGQRANGPSFSFRCFGCHGDFFPPNVTDVNAIINGVSNPEALCQDRIYIVRGSPSASLIYQKLSGPDCGSRMPQGGPFLNEIELGRLNRWITELGSVPD
jgi:hypothetical protein